MLNGKVADISIRSPRPFQQGTPRNKERNVIFRSEPVQEHYFDEGTQEQKRYYIGSARNEPIEKLFRFQALVVGNNPRLTVSSSFSM